MLADGIELEQQDHLVRVVVRRYELGQAEMTDLVGECIERLRYSAARNFVFDLEGVAFLASACIGSLVMLLQEAEHVRGRVALARCSENVQFLFKVTRLDDVFHLADTVEEAAHLLGV